MTGTVFNIQKFSINDGPGIRTTVFLKGCPLSCLWCHNPESKLARREIMYDAKKCIGCARCATVCKNGAHSFDGGMHVYLRADCTACGECCDECVAEAVSAVGEEKTAEAVLQEVMKDKMFYDTSGGGLTISGGEPMMQFDFTYELLRLAKENGLHTCIESCGYSKRENYEKILPLVDIFLFDYKETSPERHKEYTGVSNELILDNLKFIDQMGGKTVLRCPIIPTLNDRDDHFLGIAKTANSLKNIIEINVEPYHPLGSGKSVMLGKDYPLQELTFPEEKTVEEWIKKISADTEITVKRA